MVAPAFKVIVSNRERRTAMSDVDGENSEMGVT